MFAPNPKSPLVNHYDVICCGSIKILVSKLSNYNFGNDFSVGNGKCYDCAIRRTLDKQTSAVL